jgi:hypothetical protein
VRNLLSLLDSLGKTEDSESLLRRLFEGQEATLGPKDPNTLEWPGEVVLGKSKKMQSGKNMAKIW